MNSTCRNSNLWPPTPGEPRQPVSPARSQRQGQQASSPQLTTISSIAMLLDCSHAAVEPGPQLAGRHMTGLERAHGARAQPARRHPG